jgi:hypothetical protein
MTILDDMRKVRSDLEAGQPERITAIVVTDSPAMRGKIARWPLKDGRLYVVIDRADFDALPLKAVEGTSLADAFLGVPVIMFDEKFTKSLFQHWLCDTLPPPLP